MLNSNCVKFHAFIQKCTIFSPHPLTMENFKVFWVVFLYKLDHKGKFQICISVPLMYVLYMKMCQ